MSRKFTESGLEYLCNGCGKTAVVPVASRDLPEGWSVVGMELDGSRHDACCWAHLPADRPPRSVSSKPEHERSFEEQLAYRKALGLSVGPR